MISAKAADRIGLFLGSVGAAAIIWTVVFGVCWVVAQPMFNMP